MMLGAQLQVAIYEALTAPTALAGGRVYDNPPEETRRESDTGAAFPMITLGDDQVLDAGNSCDDGWEVFSDIHVWSRWQKRSKLEAKNLAAEIVDRLVGGTLTVFGWSVVIAALESQRSFRDPDGITEHTIVTVRHVLQPA